MTTIYLRGHIMVKKEFADLILSGLKTTTIRLGRVVPKSKEVIIHSGGRPVAKAVIEGVEYKRVGELSDEDAKRDGYQSVDELIKSLERIYKTKISSNDIVTIIRFRVVKKFNEIDTDDVYLGLEPIDIARLAHRYIFDELSEKDRRIVEEMLRSRSIRTVAIKMFGSLNKRWIVRKTLRKCLAKLVWKGVIKVDEDSLRKLAEVSGFWKRVYLDYVKSRRGEEGST
ncbi:MAG: ASCH domain-containing protein [Ignisphaera sp.]